MKKKASLIFSDKSLNLVFPTKNNNNSDSRHHREKESKIWPEVSVQVKKGPHSFIGQPWGIYSWLHHYDDVSVTFTTSCALISVRKIDDLWRAQNNHNNHCIVDKYRTSKYYTMIESSYPEKRLELAVNVRNINCVNLLIIHHIAENINTAAIKLRKISILLPSKFPLLFWGFDEYWSWAGLLLESFQKHFIFILFFWNGKYC